MKKIKHTAAICAAIFGAAAAQIACTTESSNGDSEAEQRCENNVIEERIDDEWVPVTDCTETFKWCAIDEAGLGTCGSETEICADAADDEWICYEDFTVTCNTTTGQGDVFRTDCREASVDPSYPGECFSYGGYWGSDFLLTDGATLLNFTLCVFLVCGN